MAVESKMKAIANVSNRHIHLCQNDMEVLFGKGHVLTRIKDLVQPEQHACKEKITIIGQKRNIENVRVLGPLRSKTQLEISMTDSILLGAKAPVRMSGDVDGSAPVKIVGPNGELELKEGCIVAKRHLHMHGSDAIKYNIKNNQTVKVCCSGERGLVFDNVVARVSDDMALECHLDTDEANAAGLKNGDIVEVLIN